MAAGLRDVFDAVAAAPVPDALQRATGADQSNVIDMSARRDRPARRFGGPLPQLAAMAATLVLGLVLGTSLNNESGSSPVEVRGGQIYAAGAVEQALESRLASTGGNGDVRIGLTFRDASGAICRSFESQESAGLACRDEGDWRLRGLFAAPEGGNADYRMAAGADPRLMEMIDSVITGEPFDAQQEQAALERGWR